MKVGYHSLTHSLAHSLAESLWIDLTYMHACMPGAATKASADLPLLQETLRLPLSTIQQAAATSSSDDLEQFNIAMKPYLKQVRHHIQCDHNLVRPDLSLLGQLSSLKSLLSGQLKEMQDSRAYFSLGLTKDASEEEIKKAYRAMAVRLHPDKPGGDTKRFQQLQDAYQQIKTKRSKHSQQSQSKKSSSPQHKPSKKQGQRQGQGQGQDGSEGQDEAVSGDCGAEEAAEGPREADQPPEEDSAQAAKKTAKKKGPPHHRADQLCPSTLLYVCMYDRGGCGRRRAGGRRRRRRREEGGGGR